MTLQMYQQMVSSLESKLSEPNLDTIARKLFALEVAKLGTRLYSSDQTIAWCGFVAPYDLLHALGVDSCCVEFVGAMLSTTGEAAASLEEAESRGFSTDICAYHRAVVGAAYQGLMPEPRFLIGTSAPCSSGLSTIERLARHFNKDLFVLHVPYQYDSTGLRFLADQLRAMVDFVVDQTGQPLDEDRLRLSMQRSNRTREILLEIHKLAATVPTPARRNDMPSLAIVLSLLGGTEAGVNLATAYRDEFRAKVASGLAGVPGEQARLLWFQNRIQFRNPVARILEEEFHAAVVVDELNEINISPIDIERPFESIAERILNYPLCGTVERRVENLKRIVRKYRIDGVIHPCHWGCRQGTGARGMIEAAMAQEGIPVLNLETDCVDQRNFSEGQIRTRLGAFMEMIINQKAGARG